MVLFMFSHWDYARHLVVLCDMKEAIIYQLPLSSYRRQYVALNDFLRVLFHSFNFIESNVSSKCHLWHRNCAFGSITQEIVMLVVIIIFKMLKLFSSSFFTLLKKSKASLHKHSSLHERNAIFFHYLRRKNSNYSFTSFAWRESGQKQRTLNSFVLHFIIFFR